MKKKSQAVKLFEKFIFLWLPVLIWASVIFSFSSNPTLHVSPVDWKNFVVKKTAHIIEYSILATLLYRAYKESGVKKVRAAIFAVITCFLYGASDEFHQSFTVGRQPSVRDVFIDTIGASITVYLIWKLLPKAPKKLRDLAKNLLII